MFASMNRAAARTLLLAGALATTTASALTCATGHIATTPTADFSVSAGTALHASTGLMWDVCSFGQAGGSCSGAPSTYNWRQAFAAVDAANAGNYKGYSDWRLPNVKELMSLAEKCRVDPAINDDVFPATSTASAGYWTSTTYNLGAAHARYVSFSSGESIHNNTLGQRTQQKPIRLVRGGQTYSPYAVARVCDLDINGDSSITAGDDGVLLIRYLLGMRGANLINNVTLGASRPDAQTVTSFIGAATHYDVFGRTAPAVSTFNDGLVLLRLMLSVPDDALLVGITVPGGAQFTTGATVRQNVNTRCGSSL